MHKQRIALIVFSLTGMAATFFKWFSGVVPLPDGILENSTGLDNYLNEGFALGTNLHSAGGWITFGVFALIFLLAAFKGKRKDPLGLMPVIVLSVAIIFFIVGKWIMEVDPSFYIKLNDQLITAYNVTRGSVEGVPELKLIPPYPDFGLYMALCSAAFILVFGFIFRKPSAKK